MRAVFGYLHHRVIPVYQGLVTSKRSIQHVPLRDVTPGAGQPSMRTAFS